ncbi:sensor histidine kinase [Actinomadura nitritigenes]|uniref:Oxygen sensor histidine kinase NreB n=1 Tax=Actinomadura nitritigenes TaxID=134602 RepID=A0ABS3R988_9ACTN|nr:sensor histidine kinase [Actinomadura nitritigenes]MBO2442796.1 sensor histidine kinase [Actinomadura nitritigenes]
MRDDPFSPAVRLLGWAVHGTFLALLAIALVRVAHAGMAAATAGGVLLGVMYAAAVVPRLREHRTRPALARAWLGLISAGWVALALSSPDFVWLAFPLFFACLHLLPLPAALPGVAVLTGAAIAAPALHGGGPTLAEVLGPCIGAAVATMMALAYGALYRESERRRLLIEELVRTRERLVRAEAGAARLAERERLAREIHDTLAQGMSSIILLLRAARRDLDHAPGAARGRLDEAEKAAAENLEEARTFVRALAPPVLQRSSLRDALRRVTESAGARSAARMRFEVSGTPTDLPTEYEVALLRIAQGALGNASRHAAARNVGVTLTYLDDMVVLDVFDDGRGFDPSAAALSEPAGPSGPDGGTGYGLRAMRDRARALGGTLTVESSPGEGTAVVASLPLPAGPDDPERGEHR